MAYKYLKGSSTLVNKELYLAVCNGQLQNLKNLLESGVDVNVRIGRDHNTLLHYAPTVEITKLLLSYGADVNVFNNDGMTPLFFAIIDNKGFDVVQQLLAHGADVNSRTSDGHTPLHFVPCLTDKNGLSVVRELLKYGANVNATDNDNATPLFFAVMCETNLEIIRELLLNGSDIDIKGRYPFLTRYFTPLDLAVDEEKIPYAKLIIKITLMKHFNEDYKKNLSLYMDAYAGSLDYKELATFLENCCSEIDKMKNNQINGNFSFYDFASTMKDTIKPLYADRTITEKEVIADYPLYHDVFWPNMKLCLERADLLNKLSKLQLYVGSPYPIQNKCQKVFVNYDCLYTIGEYLSNDDLLNFISGFDKVLNSLHIFRTTLWN
nr:serine/threonine-protein phosphatase 6 regulatory ankyrin repeat subunit A [Halyomorpha halys]